MLFLRTATIAIVTFALGYPSGSANAKEDVKDAKSAQEEISPPTIEPKEVDPHKLSLSGPPEIYSRGLAPCRGPKKDDQRGEVGRR